MTNNNQTPPLRETLKKSMRKSFLKAAKLAKDTDTPLVVSIDDKVVGLKGQEIDDYIESLKSAE